MQKQWITAVLMVALALGMTAPAWAGCNVQGALVGNHFGSGTAQEKVAAATLKSPAVNKFEVDVQGAGAGVVYVVMVSTNSTSVFPLGYTAAGAFMTNSLGAGEWDTTGRTDTCSIQRVAVVSAPAGVNALTGKMNGLAMNDDAPEVQAETQVEAEAQLNDVMQNEVQLEPQPAPATPNL